MTEQSKEEHCNQLPSDEQFQDEQIGIEQTRFERLGEMTDGSHPELQEIERLLNGSLSGERLVAALIHLEDCNYCQQKLPPVEAETLLKAVFEDGELSGDADCTSENNSVNKNYSS